MEQNQGMLTCSNPSCKHQFPVDMPTAPGQYTVNCPVCGTEVIFDILPPTPASNDFSAPNQGNAPAGPMQTPPSSQKTVIFGSPDEGTQRKDYGSPFPSNDMSGHAPTMPFPGAPSDGHTQIADNNPPMSNMPPMSNNPQSDMSKTVVGTGAAFGGGQFNEEKPKKPILKWIIIILIPLALIVAGVILGIKDRESSDSRTAGEKLDSIMSTATAVEAEAVEAADSAMVEVVEEAPAAEAPAPAPVAQTTTQQTQSASSSSSSSNHASTSSSASSSSSSSSSTSTPARNDALELLKVGINEANKNIFPQDAGMGITITRAYISGDYVVYSCECDETQLDVSILESVKNEMKEEMKNMIRSASDPTITEMVRLCVNAGKGLGFQYIGDTSGQKVSVYLSHSELKRLL